jgi:hypothetical protein
VALISAINGVAALIFVYMQYYSTPEWLIIVAQFLWSQAHGLCGFDFEIHVFTVHAGFPSVIYLSMSPIIRAEAKRFVQR